MTFTNSSPYTTHADVDHTDLDAVVKFIRRRLKERSGKTWSVTRSRGSSYGWLTITAPKKRLVDGWKLSDADAQELGELLGCSGPVHHQGESVPSGYDFHAEYVDRAHGVEPLTRGVAHWD